MYIAKDQIFSLIFIRIFQYGALIIPVKSDSDSPEQDY